MFGGVRGPAGDSTPERFQSQSTVEREQPSGKAEPDGIDADSEDGIEGCPEGSAIEGGLIEQDGRQTGDSEADHIV